MVQYFAAKFESYLSRVGLSVQSPPKLIMIGCMRWQIKKYEIYLILARFAINVTPSMTAVKCTFCKYRKIRLFLWSITWRNNKFHVFHVTAAFDQSLQTKRSQNCSFLVRLDSISIAINAGSSSYIEIILIHALIQKIHDCGHYVASRTKHKK